MKEGRIYKYSQSAESCITQQNTLLCFHRHRAAVCSATDSSKKDLEQQCSVAAQSLRIGGPQRSYKAKILSRV